MLVAQWRAAGIQASSTQGVWHAEAIEHAADAGDAEAPERTFTVDGDQVLEAAQLVSSSRVKVEFAAFPARPGVGRHPEQLRRLDLGERAQCSAQLDQVELRVAGWDRAIRHV